MHITRLQRIEERKKILQKAGMIVSLLLIVGVGFFISRVLGFYNTIHTGNQSQEQTEKEKTEYNILLLGYGGGTHAGAYLTDTIMLVNIDLEEKKVLLLSVPRDIWVKVPTKNDPFYSKINAVYQMGLFPDNYPDVDTKLLTTDNPSGLIKKVMEDVTGLKVDAFVAADFQGFKTAIDTLNGIDVKVERSFTDFEYPVEGKEEDLCGKKEEEFEELEKIATESPEVAYPCRYETLTFTTGVTHMDGDTALKFARSRHSEQDGGDFNRAHRQQQVLAAVKDKVLRIDFISKILPLMDDLEDNISTDLPLADMNKLLLEARNANQYKISSFVISDEYLMYDISENGQFIVVPTLGIDNWKQIQRKVQEIKLGISPTPTIITN